MVVNTKLLIVITVASLLALAFSIKNYIDNQILYCDLQKGFYAERMFTYPILRTIDDPDNYGREYKNPLTSDSRYRNCEFFSKYFK